MLIVLGRDWADYSRLAPSGVTDPTSIFWSHDGKKLYMAFVRECGPVTTLRIRLQTAESSPFNLELPRSW